MKVFYHSLYRFYRPQVKKQINLFLISDIHFSHSLRSQTMNAVIERAKTEAPDYILIPGDLIDSLTSLDEPSEQARFSAFFEQLGKIAPVIAGLGNHDFYRVPEGSKNNIWTPWEIDKPEKLKQSLEPLNRVILLDNQTYEDDRVLVFGFTQTPEYYSMDLRKKGEHGPTSVEDRNVLIHDLEQIEKSRLTKLPKNKLKIALVHSPIRLDDPEVIKFFDEFDLVITGHTHNGATPPILHDFWFSNRGLMAPGRGSYLPDRTRIGIYDKKIILCGPITTIQSHAHPLTPLNYCFPVHVARVEISDNDIYERKPGKKHKYIGF